ncbi:hypothetical protein SAMN02745157_2516 [Kaistia soli DSM 19436]|uniref:Uncharacterized protein n=1 Tax=Kaistia soli DSM 19436 TaxID=1122133 RepID=A0A1M5CZW9_9HYPH|nr:hypothetical protein [Kaistia soli]SHF60197.1 hypothetical protein SAMN02745157_2516 [Kaistia soli DSM 19436]
MTEPLVDQMDGGLDLIRVSRIALLAEGWIDQDAAEAIGHSLDIALKMLSAPREHLNRERGA